MKIALDVLGFENDLSQAIKATILILKKYADSHVILVGDEKKLSLAMFPKKLQDRVSFHHATQEITMDHSPLQAMRMPDSSMAQAIQLVKNKKAQAVVSAGNSGCFVGLVFFYLGMISGIKKVGFMPCFPTADGKGMNVLDVGANITVTAQDLVDFAIMANFYCQNTRMINKPRIGILNIGTEQHKGFEYHHQADQQLRTIPEINYVGFVEPRTLLNGGVDVVVTDGFAGNIYLKASEGALKTVGEILKTTYRKPWNWLAAVLSLGLIKKIKKTFDYRNNAGAVVLGTPGIAIKTHGNADWKQFFSAIEMAYVTYQNKSIEKIVAYYERKK